MLRRLISRQVHLLRPLLPHPTPIPITSFSAIDTVHFRHLRFFSTSGRDGSDDPNDPWKISPESDELESSLFASIKEATEKDSFISDPADETKPSDASDAWGAELTTESKDDVFSSIEKEAQTAANPRMGGWDASGGFKPWSMGEDEQKDDLFANITNVEPSLQQTGVDGIEEETKQEPELDVEELKRKEKELMKTLKGPNRAFGDLIAASGVTEGMIDSLILLKDVRDIPGLPPLKEIEDKAIANLEAYASQSNNNNNLEGQTAITRVKQVDDKGRSYATGRRKCSVARVWIQPGEGKFSVNEKEFDVYFPILDQRAELLRPFTVTDTLGKWDVRCTVKGGGTSGQVGAIRLGVSRALQNFEPAYRPYLKAVGYLTRDPRAVERKKPGKAKARKSFQWVKR